MHAAHWTTPSLRLRSVVTGTSQLPAPFEPNPTLLRPPLPSQCPTESTEGILPHPVIKVTVVKLQGQNLGKSSCLQQCLLLFNQILNSVHCILTVFNKILWNQNGLLDHITQLGQTLYGKFWILTLKIYSFTVIFFSCKFLTRNWVNILLIFAHTFFRNRVSAQIVLKFWNIEIW